MLEQNETSSAIARADADAGVRRTEAGSGPGQSRITWSGPRPEIVRAAFEGRRLRSAMVAHASLVDRLVGTYAPRLGAVLGHQRAREEMESSVSRSRAELRGMVRRFAFRLAADGLSEEHTIKMVKGLVESALVDARSQRSSALATEMVQW